MFAQQPQQAAPTTAVQSAETDDDAALRPLEPDFTLINLPTTLPLPLHKGNFRLTHRFNGNLRGGTFGDEASSLFGIDEGATVGFEYRFAVIRHVEAAAYRTGFDRTIQLYGKYDPFHQSSSMPIGVSAVVSVEGTNNFREHYAPAVGASISREVLNVARYMRCRCGSTIRPLRPVSRGTRASSASAAASACCQPSTSSVK